MSKQEKKGSATLPLGQSTAGGKNTPPNAPESPVAPVSLHVEETPVSPVLTPPETPQRPETPVAVVPRPTLSTETQDELALAQYEATTRAGLPTEKMLSVMAKFASHCVDTGQMPRTVDTAAKAIIVFQAGRELGIPPMKSLYSFYFVNNKLTMYGATVIERIRQWGMIEYGTCNETEATVTITRKDDHTSLSATVRMKDLEEKGLTAGKDTFKKHPRTMLIYKAVGQIVRHIVPEAVGAMAVEGDYAEDADTEQSLPKKRSGKVETVDPITSSDAEVPSLVYVSRNYDLPTIQNRLKELGVEFDEKETKGILAGKLVDKLREMKEESKDIN